MFCRKRPPLLVPLVTITAVFLSACPAKQDKQAPSASAPAPRAFELQPPRGYHETEAAPPLAGVWQAATQKNGFTPTLNVARRALPAGTPEQIYVTWRDELLGVLNQRYQEVKILDERPFHAGAQTGKLIILVVTVPRPAGQANEKLPMPLFSYGAALLTDDALWELGAFAPADLDARTGRITPAGEAEILSALASFRVR